MKPYAEFEREAISDVARTEAILEPVSKKYVWVTYKDGKVVGTAERRYIPDVTERVLVNKEEYEAYYNQVNRIGKIARNAFELHLREQFPQITDGAAYKHVRDFADRMQRDHCESYDEVKPYMDMAWDLIVAVNSTP